jgi:hypothetical protein
MTMRVWKRDHAPSPTTTVADENEVWLDGKA